MVLLWGVPSDPPLAAIEKILIRERVPYVFLDQRAILDTELNLKIDERVRGILRVQGDMLDLESVKAVYPRPYNLEQIRSVAEIAPHSPEFRHATEFHQAFSIWLDLTPALVLNRPREMAFNYSKPYQATIIEAVGFAIPKTLLTTDPAEVLIFRKNHTEIIYKSVSAVRSIVTQLRDNDEDRLENVAWCPTQFQQRIIGTDVRVHVIGNEIFACEIVSEADDYRYAPLSENSIEIHPFDLPQGCANRCRKLAATMSFVISGIDLRRENGIWYCFEANPSPGFTFYQEQTGQPIDEAIAHLLEQAQS